MKLALVVVLGIAACGGPRSTAPGAGVGGAGDGSATAPAPREVCAVGTRNPDPASVVVVACGEGMACCYPCGIEGCDSVCMADCGPARP